MAARDEHGNTVKRGVYVNATLTDEEQGNRQGVHWDDNSDGSIQVQGELELYHCKPDVTVVPDCNLRFGNTKRFVMTLREQNSLDYRWQHEEVL